jgi:hypothetical protein
MNARYEHAAELQNSASPETQLGYLVDELARWAKLNPALVPLWAEFGRVLVLIRNKS